MDQPAQDNAAIAPIAGWLIAAARLTCAPLELIDGFCRRLLAPGIPLWRPRAIANPLASAWGVIWTGAGNHECTVPRTAQGRRPGAGGVRAAGPRQTRGLTWQTR